MGQQFTVVSNSSEAATVTGKKFAPTDPNFCGEILENASDKAWRARREPRDARRAELSATTTSTNTKGGCNA
jgi:hypothetical protein